MADEQSLANIVGVCSWCGKQKYQTTYDYEEWEINCYRILCPNCKEEYKSIKENNVRNY